MWLPPPPSPVAAFFCLLSNAVCFLSASIASIAVAASGCASGETASGGAATGGVTQAGDADAAPGAEPTCEDRARIAPLCTSALTQRCQSQANEGEAPCDSRAGLPGNTRTTPSEKNEPTAVACRQDCRVGYDACIRKLVPQCPQPCP